MQKFNGYLYKTSDSIFELFFAPRYYRLTTYNLEALQYFQEINSVFLKKKELLYNLDKYYAINNSNYDLILKESSYIIDNKYHLTKINKNWIITYNYRYIDENMLPKVFDNKTLSHFKTKSQAIQKLKEVVNNELKAGNYPSEYKDYV